LELGGGVVVSPRQLWIHQAIEASAGDPYSELVIYGQAASLAWDPLSRVAVQCRTNGTNKAAVLARAQLLLETLFDSDGYPQRMLEIPGYAMDQSADGHWTIVSADPPPAPWMIAPDNRNRANAVFNFDCGFFKNES
jgi:hypothetical protein